MVIPSFCQVIFIQNMPIFSSQKWSVPLSTLLNDKTNQLFYGDYHNWPNNIGVGQRFEDLDTGYPMLYLVPTSSKENSVDPGQNAPKGSILTRVHTVCFRSFVPIFSLTTMKPIGSIQDIITNYISNSLKSVTQQYRTHVKVLVLRQRKQKRNNKLRYWWRRTRHLQK